MDGWNTSFLLGYPIFSGELLVLGGVLLWVLFGRETLQFQYEKNPSMVGTTKPIMRCKKWVEHISYSA